jgi:phospho-N-acetylmuramoyl-pentapeptide-transferase
MVFVLMSSLAVSFMIASAFSTPFLAFLKKQKLGKMIRTEASGGGSSPLFHKLHKKKMGTPTLGGILIWGTVLFTVLGSRFLSYFGYISRSLLDRGEVYLPLLTLIVMGILGAIDDYLNIQEGKTKGITPKPKMFFLLLFSGIGAYWFYFKLGYTAITIPFLGLVPLGLWYIPLFMFIITGTSNAVNITDGLDGLAGGLLLIAFASFSFLAFYKGLFVLSVFCAVIMGAILAFLWNNVPPAKFYMGDTGSLSLGATLGVIAMMTDFLYVLPFVGFIFMAETISVLLQWTSKRLRNKKLFHIAPIHHHFEYIGWGESQIVMRFWILGAFFSGFGILLGIFILSI